MKRRTRNVRGLVLPLLLALCAPAVASAQGAGGNPSNWCRDGAFASDAKEFKLARVGGDKNARAYFYGEEEGCPAQTAKCRQKAYVVAGDEVVVSRTFGDFVCAWYQPPRGYETTGWIRADQLNVIGADSNPPPARWVGEWELHENRLSIRRDSKTGKLVVEGSAVWHGLGDNVHVGEVNAQAAPAGNTLALDDDICHITFRLVGDHLVADDNGECGGANVTFDGVYRRKKK